MQTVEEVLAYSIHLESEAAARFGELADAMQSAGNREVAGLFRRLSDYSKLHLADARARAAGRLFLAREPRSPQNQVFSFMWMCRKTRSNFVRGQAK